MVVTSSSLFNSDMSTEGYYDVLRDCKIVKCNEHLYNYTYFVSYSCSLSIDAKLLCQLQPVLIVVKCINNVLSVGKCNSSTRSSRHFHLQNCVHKTKLKRRATKLRGVIYTLSNRHDLRLSTVEEVEISPCILS